MKFFILLLFSATTRLSLGQVQTYYIKPIQTDANYLPTEDSSAVSRNTSFQLNKLFLFIGGTGSSSSTDYNALRIFSANLGFDFINLSYPNAVAAASLANSTDSLAFNKYRQEVCFGTPLSPDVTVDSFNSIYTRALKLVQYLSVTYPAENWGQYLATPTSLDWSKIIVGGHSQGSGHACYLAKQYLVDRLLMFSGPNDYSNTFSNSANWLRQAGVTPVDQYFIYLSLNDEAVDFSKQFVNMEGLGMLVSDDTTYVDHISTPYENSHCLYTTQPPGLGLINHNAPIIFSTINNSVWTYMLTSPITTAVENSFENTAVSIYPNPASNFISIEIQKDNPGDLANEVLLLYLFDSLGRPILKQSFFNSATVQTSQLANGIYFYQLSGEHGLIKTGKLIRQ